MLPQEWRPFQYGGDPSSLKLLLEGTATPGSPGSASLYPKCWQQDPLPQPFKHFFRLKKNLHLWVGQKKVLDLLGQVLQVVLCASWELNWDPLGERLALVTAEPSLQPRSPHRPSPPLR